MKDKFDNPDYPESQEEWEECEFDFVDSVVDILNGLLKRSYSFMLAVRLINDAHKECSKKEVEDD